MYLNRQLVKPIMGTHTVEYCAAMEKNEVDKTKARMPGVPVWLCPLRQVPSLSVPLPPL